MVQKKSLIWSIVFFRLCAFLCLFAISSTASLGGEEPGQNELEKNRPGLSIQETFAIYVQSIQNSDLKSLFTTVTDNDKVFFLTSSGVLIDSRDGYYKFHKEWFRTKGWEMPVELLDVHEGKEYAYTTAIFHYLEKIPEGEMLVLDSYFTLIFHREEDMWKVVADVCTPISRYSKEPDQDIKYSSEQTYLFEILKTRRTVRKFKPSPVPEEHILKIIDAARFAPTAGNQQPWKFLVIQDRERVDNLRDAAFKWAIDQYKKQKKPSLEELAKAEENLKRILENVCSAPVYVVVLVDAKTDYPDYILYDGTLAAGNLMIAARALGYGTGFFTTFFPEAQMREFFKIPENYRLICVTPIGIPDQWPKVPDKKAIKDLIVFEKF
jgi:nitroreductase/ketosteroid isomerase-like protein